MRVLLLKFLVEDGRFDYIESGSLLGVKYKEVKSYPVGYEKICQMYPLNFPEIFRCKWCSGGNSALFKKCIRIENSCK